tara:strand:- start:661 stop:1518 length:858 start_codon:yes stop_codon:yes gene_type:complete
MAHNYLNPREHRESLINQANSDEFDLVQFCNIEREWFKKILGNQWIKKREAKLKKTGRIVYPIHGLLAHSYHLVNEIKKGTGLFTPDNYFLELVNLIKILRKLETIKGFSDKIEKLKTQKWTDFNAVIFELKIASSYMSSLSEVEFIEERPDKRTPDILVKHPKGDFQVECKSRQIREISTMVDTKTYIHRIMKDASNQFDNDIPGVLFCQLLAENNIDKAHRIMNVIKNIITESLNSNHNRNINEICIMIPCYPILNDGNKKGRSLTNVQEWIRHPNPRYIFKN